MKEYSKKKLCFKVPSFVGTTVTRLLMVLPVWWMVCYMIKPSENDHDARQLLFVTSSVCVIALVGFFSVPFRSSRHRTLADFKVGSYARILTFTSCRVRTKDYYGVYAVFMPIDSVEGAVLVAVPDEFEDYLKGEELVPIRFVERGGQMTHEDLHQQIIPIVLSNFAPKRKVRRPSVRDGVIQA